MKKLILILVVGILLSSVFVISASDVDVNNLSLTKEYAPYDILKGFVNLTIKDFELNTLITCNLDNDAEMTLEDWLGGEGICEPADCEAGYETSGSGAVSKTISVPSHGSKFFGFVLDGGDVDEITSLMFNVSSDFAKEDEVPLKFVFFEDDDIVLEFKQASNDYSREDKGCFGSSSNQVEVQQVRFCGRFNVSETPSLRIGANIITGSGTGSLEMVIYDDGGLEEDCPINPAGGVSSCIVDNSQEGFEEGVYYVCLEADRNTGYKILKEEGNTNNSCGWSKGGTGFSVPSTFIKDYNLFVKYPKYNSSAGLVKYFEGEMEDCGTNTCWEEIVDSANDFINNKYGGDCEDGCVLPVEVFGVSQNLQIKDLGLRYAVGTSDDNEPRSTNKIYFVNKIPAIVNFEGELDLEELGFNVGSRGTKNVELQFDGSGIGLGGFSNRITVLNAPVILSVSPTNPPAGVLTLFSANVDYSGNISSYVWDFGDGNIEETDESFVRYAYNDIGSFTMKVNVTAGNFTTSKSFTILAGSPRDIVDKVLVDKKKRLNDTRDDIAGFPAWLRSELEDLANLTYYDSELKTLQTSISNAFTDDDFLKIAIALHELDVPKVVFISEKGSSGLFTGLADISVAPILTIGGGSGTDAEYANSILQWQKNNIEATIETERVAISRDISGINVVMSVYDVSVKSNYDGESYFVIGKEFPDLEFNQGQGRKAGDYSIVILDKNVQKDIEFYFLGDGEVVFYASPKISFLPVGTSLGACDNDGDCESGEDVDNCPDDCKPYGLAILYILLIIIFALMVYTILQVWYKTRYEKHLFKDRRHLFNLLMFIDNARARGLDDDEIREQLKDKNWSGEQLTYAIKKSRGERTGMFELIPIEFVLAWWRRRKAEKRVQGESAEPSGMVGMGGGGFHPRKPGI